MYDEAMVKPMREDLTQLGVKELRTAEEVDAALQNHQGTTLVVVNSVCGCSAAGARPAVERVMRHPVQPDNYVTVFAGQDSEATAQARRYFDGYEPSSPQMGLLKDGKLVFMLERQHIEGNLPMDIAACINEAFDQHCGNVLQEVTTESTQMECSIGEESDGKWWQVWK
jgi:putative YphP/YqiW family bacilliredoxin